MNKRVKKGLILGVGNAQVDAIRYLKRTGWWVIGCSYRHEGRGLPLVDQFELIDIADWASLVGLGRREKIDLVYSVGSDLAMSAVAKVGSELSLPIFVDYGTTQLMQNKTMLRDFLAARNISPVKYKKVRSIADLDGWDSFPAIVKPADSQGQRGIFRANSIGEIRAGLESSLGFSKSKTVIVEEFLDGPEVSANAFVVDSQVVFNRVSDRLVVDGYPGGIPRGHVFPTKQCRNDDLIATESLVEQCIRALGISNGPIYVQIKLTPEGPRIIEVTPRLDGCHIWRLIKTATGVDLLEASFELLTGDNSLGLRGDSSTESYRLGFFLSPPGTVFREVDHRPPVEASHLEYYYRDGEAVRPVNGLLEKVGYFIAQEQ